MIVNDLIEKLKLLPPNARVVRKQYSDNEYHFYGEEVDIELASIELSKDRNKKDVIELKF